MFRKHISITLKTHRKYFITVVLDRRENKSAGTGKFELAYRDNPHPGFKCVDNKFYIEGARIRKSDLQRYAELDKRTRQKEKEIHKNRRKQAEEEKVKEIKEICKQNIEETTDDTNENNDKIDEPKSYREVNEDAKEP